MTPLPLGNGAGDSARTAPIQTPMLTRMAYISVLHAAVPRGAATPDNQFPEAYPASEMLGFWDRAARWRSQSLFLVGGLHYSADMNWKGDNWARARLSPQTVLLGEAAKRRGFQVRGLAFCRGVISSSSDFCHSLITVLSQSCHSLITALSQSCHSLCVTFYTCSIAEAMVHFLNQGSGVSCGAGFAVLGTRESIWLSPHWFVNP